MIRYIADRRIWVVETAQTAYVIGIAGDHQPRLLYYGPKLAYEEDYCAQALWQDTSYKDKGPLGTREYPMWRFRHASEPAVKATFADGVRDGGLAYESYRIEKDSLMLRLKDRQYPFAVELIYQPVEGCDLIVRRAVILNEGDAPIMLEQALSGMFSLPSAEDFRLTYLAGLWCAEFQVRRIMLPDAKMTMESRVGITSHHAASLFMLDAGARAQEESGEVFFGTLAYSGNWKVTLEKDTTGNICVGAGIHDFDFAWKLEGGERFETPDWILGYTGGGFGQASRNLHRYQLGHVLPEEHRASLSKVMYNSWYATLFNVNCEQQCRLADIAASLGVEVFIMDDGWFSTRFDDLHGLGDWEVSPDKFPEGLDPLIKHVNGLGMAFGLWFEPEMVNPDTKLYEAHPDWIYHFPTRERNKIRNQHVLNAAREDVQAYMFKSIDTILSRYNIRHIKWDFNRPISEPGWPEVEDARQREMWVRHVDGLYSVAQKLKEKHPQVVFENCAGGAGRMDLGIMRYFDQCWASDNTDGYDRLCIQEGYTYAFAPKTMGYLVDAQSTVFNNRRMSLTYLAHCGMTGLFGLGDDLSKWDEAEKEEARALVALYKDIRPLVQHGSLYRLLSPAEGPLTAVEYTDKQRAVVFFFLAGNHFNKPLHRVRLCGLDPARRYRVEGVEGIFSGEVLMRVGIDPGIKGDFVSRVVRIEPVEKA